MERRYAKARRRSAPPAMRATSRIRRRPGRRDRRGRRPGPSATPWPPPPRRSPAPAAAPRRRPPPSGPSRAKVLARRRRTTTVLFLAFTVGAIVAAVGGIAFLWAPALPALLLTAYIVYLRARSGGASPSPWTSARRRRQRSDCGKAEPALTRRPTSRPPPTTPPTVALTPPRGRPRAAPPRGPRAHRGPPRPRRADRPRRVGRPAARTRPPAPRVRQLGAGARTAPDVRHRPGRPARDQPRRPGSRRRLELRPLQRRPRPGPAARHPSRTARPPPAAAPAAAPRSSTSTRTRTARGRRTSDSPRLTSTGSDFRAPRPRC